MANISRSIDVQEPVDAVNERWAEFEKLPRCTLAGTEARVRWRAEVLTFEPRGDSTRVTVRIDYDPAGGDAGLSRSIEDTLQAFKTFAESRAAGAAAWPSLAPAGAGWKS